MTRLPISEILFHTYRLILIILTAIVSIRLVCDFDWSKSALYGICTICSYFVGQAIVFFLQNRQQPVRQKNDW